MATKPSFMEIALEEARDAAHAGEVPVGAIVVREGEIIARARNAILQAKDPTGHAEILALRKAAEITGSERLVDCDLYVTLEPCTMCAGAISLARIRRLYFGASDEKAGAVENGVRFFAQPSCHHRPEIYSGINEEACSALLKRFFQERRGQVGNS